MTIFEISITGRTIFATCINQAMVDADGFYLGLINGSHCQESKDKEKIETILVGLFCHYDRMPNINSKR